MTTETETTEIVLYNPASGELLRLAVETAEDERLADVLEATIPTLIGQLKDAKDIVDREVLARLDRSGRWTRRVGDPKNVQWEITSPSPVAGTETVDVGTLAEVLDEALDERIIDQSAAGAALVRTVQVTFLVGSDEEAERIIDTARQDDRVIRAEAHRKVSAAGVKALEKIPAMRDRVALAKVPCDPPRRTPKVRRLDRREVRR